PLLPYLWFARSPLTRPCNKLPRRIVECHRPYKPVIQFTNPSIHKRPQHPNHTRKAMWSPLETPVDSTWHVMSTTDSFSKVVTASSRDICAIPQSDEISERTRANSMPLCGSLSTGTPLGSTAPPGSLHTHRDLVAEGFNEAEE